MSVVAVCIVWPKIWPDPTALIPAQTAKPKASGPNTTMSNWCMWSTVSVIIRRARYRAVSCRRGSAQKQCSTWHSMQKEDMQEGVTDNKWPEKCGTKKRHEFDGLKHEGQIVKKMSRVSWRLHQRWPASADRIKAIYMAGPRKGVLPKYLTHFKIFYPCQPDVCTSITQKVCYPNVCAL